MKSSRQFVSDNIVPRAVCVAAIIMYAAPMKQQAAVAQSPLKLRHIVQDDFRSDSRRDYTTTGQVDWKPGQLSLGAGAALIRSIEAGAHAEVRLKLGTPPLTEAEQSQWFIRFGKPNSSQAVVRITRIGKKDFVATQIDVLSVRGLLQLRTERRIIEERDFGSGEWRFGYRHGVVTIHCPDGYQLQGFVGDDANALSAVEITSTMRNLVISRAEVDVRPKPAPFKGERAEIEKEFQAKLDSARRSQRSTDLPNAKALFEEAVVQAEKLGADGELALAHTQAELADVLRLLGDEKEAIRLYDTSRPVLLKWLGPDHPEIAFSWNNYGLCLESLGYSADAAVALKNSLRMKRDIYGELHERTVRTLLNVGGVCCSIGEYRQAEETLRKVLDAIDGLEQYDRTLKCQLLNNHGIALQNLGAHQEALKALSDARRIAETGLPDTEGLLRQILQNLAKLHMEYGDDASRAEVVAELRKRLPPPQGAGLEAWTNFLSSQGTIEFHLGQFDAARRSLSSALVYAERRFGDDHPSLVPPLSSLADVDIATGRFNEALSRLARAAAIAEAFWGPAHPRTATVLCSMARLHAQLWDFKRAENLYREAIAAYAKSVGKPTSAEADARIELASVYYRSERSQMAVTELEAAIEFYTAHFPMRKGMLGRALHDLSDVQWSLRHSKQAGQSWNKARSIIEDAFGPKSRQMAALYSSRYTQFMEAGRTDDAATMLALVQPMHAGSSHLLDQARLAIRRGDLGEAENSLRRLLDESRRERTINSLLGIEYAGRTGQLSPERFLASVLAQEKRFVEATEVLESGFGVGVRLEQQIRQHFSNEEAAKLRELNQKVLFYENLCNQSIEVAEPDELSRVTAMAFRQQFADARDALANYREMVSKRDIPIAKTRTWSELQSAIPDDSAVVSWFSADRHWLVVLRRTAPPAWIELGEVDASQIEAIGHAAGLMLGRGLTPLDEEVPPDWDRIEQALWARLEEHLRARDDLPAVRRLIVLPSPLLSGMPVECIAPEPMIIQYIPSLHWWADLGDRHVGPEDVDPPAQFLGVGDPLFRDSASDYPSLPEGGLFVVKVLKNSLAEMAGVKAFDVLLQLGELELNKSVDLVAELKRRGSPGKEFKLRIWRGGQQLELKMPPWKDGATLGVAYARMTTPRDFIEHRVRLQRRMLQLSRQSWRPLPGSRVEVSSIAEVFQRVGGKCVTLIGTDATAHRISELATKGVLRDFDYLLFATHGEVETLSPFDSRIILGSPSADFGLSSVMRFENLRRDVTAREILQQWQLRARVVAISACESGRGPEAGGEGYLGFAQALLLAGADNVVLAMAPVDDTASTLLMHRFFRNLLDGPADAKAMPSAEALHEAKVWLRQSNAGELKTLLKHIGGDYLLLPTTNPSTLPYKDPKYWAPFVLIGSGV